MHLDTPAARQAFTSSPGAIRTAVVVVVVARAVATNPPVEMRQIITPIICVIDVSLQLTQRNPVATSLGWLKWSYLVFEIDMIYPTVRYSKKKGV
jgi:hypothetical protein